ncbi:MAG TPA: S8 family peptidase [Candidatus Limnocylindrales bacterium]
MKLNRLAGKRPAAMAVSIIATATMLASATGGAQAAPQGDGGLAVYLVQTSSEPLATNDSTAPAEGEKVNAKSAVAQQWLSRLRSEHDGALRASQVSTARKVTDYGVVFNGFAAKLTPAEVLRLRNTAGVVNVWKDQIVHADTTTTRDFLGLTGNKGVWEKQFRGDEHAGEGMIVGIVDSGVWPENPAFAPLSEPRPDAATIAAKWSGTCDTGQASDPGATIACNNKLIGARYYKDGIEAGGGAVGDYEFLSPRDFNGHGSHTASTAAGNFNVPVTISGFNVGNSSGVAPAARVAMYKALWEQPDGTASGSTADLVAAINQAVADGVDVINYSISGSRTFVVDAAEIAFFNAAAAGVFVSASAGNSGDTVGASSVAHNSPWLTTVAASTHNRGNGKTLTLGNGQATTNVGVIPPAVASSPLVLSSAVGLAGANPTNLVLCGPGTLDPAKTAGKIVVCDRGVFDRVAKSLAVKDAGGAGMVLANTSDAQSINGDWHYVPTIHISATQAAPIKAYAATAGATASMSVTDPNPVTAPAMAGFSSFGPALAGNGDLLKPDITAPGVDVIASVAPPGNAGRDFDAYSGTSMSSPHIAGIATLIKAKNPTWSPMAVKSAMMTTASTKDTSGKTIQWPFGDATPLNFGAGHVVPGSAFDPGLVYDSGPAEWIKYGCGLGQFQLITAPEFCQQQGSIDPSDLNYASIAVGDLAGSQTITRTVKNVSKKVGVYLPVVKAPAGFKVKVDKPVLVVLPGKTATFKVTITRTTAALSSYAFGSLTLKEIGTGRHTVTSPIAVRPVGVAAAVEVTGTGASGSSQQPLVSGIAGTLSTKVSGLAASSQTALAFAGDDTGFNPNAPAESPGVKKITVTVPAGTQLARFATFDADVPAGTDVDLFAYRGGALFGQSAGGTTEESITFTQAGTYDIYVVLFAHTGAIPPITHHAFAVQDVDAGNLTVNPASQPVTIAGRTSITLAWSGLTAGNRYLGIVSYTDGSAAIGRTLVSIGA